MKALERIEHIMNDDMQKQLREDLMNEAINDASSKADTLAKSLGVEITGVKTSSISESNGPRVYYEYDMAVEEKASGAVSTPIEPGESTVSMSVQVTYYIK